MNTLTTKTETKNVSKRNVNKEIESAILTPQINLLLSVKADVKKKAQKIESNRVEKITKIISLCNVARLRKVKILVRKDDNLTPKVKRTLLDEINARINVFNKEKLTSKFANHTAKIRTEKYIRVNENESEYATILNIVKAIRDKDKERNVSFYGILKTKKFKLSSLNLFLSVNQIADVITKGGLYNFKVINNAIEKLQSLKDTHIDLIYAHADETHAILTDINIPFIDKLTAFESLKSKVSL